MTHEFHFISNAGEDQVLICNGCSEYFNREIVNQKDGGVHSNEERTLVCPTCHSQDLSSFPTIEVNSYFLILQLPKSFTSYCINYPLFDKIKLFRLDTPSSWGQSIQNL